MLLAGGTSCTTRTLTGSRLVFECYRSGIISANDASSALAREHSDTQLAQLLKDEDREDAGRLLVDALGERQSGDNTIAAKAILAWFESISHGHAAPELEPHMPDPDICGESWARLDVLLNLCQRPAPVIKERMEEILRDEREWVAIRACAGLVLAKLGSPAAKEFALKTLWEYGGDEMNGEASHLSAIICLEIADPDCVSALAEYAYRSFYEFRQVREVWEHVWGLPGSIKVAHALLQEAEDASEEPDFRLEALRLAADCPGVTNDFRRKMEACAESMLHERQGTRDVLKSVASFLEELREEIADDEDGKQ